MMADETLLPQRKYGLLLSSAIAPRNPIVTAAMEAAAGAVMTPAAVETEQRLLVICTSRLQFRIQDNAVRLRMNWLWQSRG